MIYILFPFMYLYHPAQYANQLDLPISPHGRYYIKVAPLHPTDDPQIIIRTDVQKLITF